jgi:hypothetical protein
VWSLSLVCGTQAHKTFHLVESSHHFIIVYITFAACYKTLGSFFKMMFHFNMDMFYRWHLRKSASRENMYYESLQATSSK